jgi:hypothetical protein
MIIETSSGQRFKVQDNAATPHAWLGVEVKAVRGAYVPKAKARPILVRKAATRIVSP